MQYKMHFRNAREILYNFLIFIPSRGIYLILKQYTLTIDEYSPLEVKLKLLPVPI